MFCQVNRRFGGSRLSCFTLLQCLRKCVVSVSSLAWKCLPSGPVGKESACNARDRDTAMQVPSWASEALLKNPTDRGAWRPTVHGAAKSQVQLSDRALESAGKRGVQRGVERMQWPGQSPLRFPPLDSEMPTKSPVPLKADLIGVKEERGRCLDDVHLKGTSQNGSKRKNFLTGILF